MKYTALIIAALCSLFSFAQSDSSLLTFTYIQNITTSTNPSEIDPELVSLDNHGERSFTGSINGNGYNIPALAVRFGKDEAFSFMHYRTQKFGHIVEWTVPPAEMKRIKAMFNKVELNDTNRVQSLFGIQTKPDSAFTLISDDEYYFTRLLDDVLYYFNPLNDSVFHTTMFVEWTEAPAKVRWREGMQKGCAGTAEMMYIVNGTTPSRLDSSWQPVELEDTISKIAVRFDVQSKIVNGPTSRWSSGESGPFIQQTRTSIGDFYIYVTYKECGDILKETIRTHSSSSRSSVTTEYIRNEDNQLTLVMTDNGPTDILYIDDVGFLYRFDEELEAYIFTFASKQTWNRYLNSFGQYPYTFVPSNEEKRKTIRRPTLSQEQREFIAEWRTKRNNEVGDSNHPDNAEQVVFPSLDGSDCDTKNKDEAFQCLNFSLQMHIVREFQYPELSRQMGSSGKAWVDFVIEKDGYVNHIQLLRSSGDEYIDAEAMRAVSTLPRMTPATVDGRPVRIRFTVPLNARLE